MKTQIKKTTRRRIGATAVEFAIVAPIFIVSVLGCLEFARFWMAEAIVENAVFQTARHVSVYGATTAEAEEFALRELSIIGIEEFQIELLPTENGVTQTVISDATTDVELTISVPAKEVSILNLLLGNMPLVKRTSIATNRIN